MMNPRLLLTTVVLGVSALLFAACGGGGGGAAPAPAASNTITFTATLTLAQEVPTPTTPVGAIPSGTGTVILDPATGTLTGTFTTQNVVNVTAAHIHDGDIGVAGDIVVPLQQSPAGSGTWVVPAGTPALTAAQIARLRAGGYYVNVHTALNLPGEIRGQLIPPGATSTTFAANLTLAQEEPAPQTPAVTPSGSGTVTLDPATGILTATVITQNVVNATAAHIHDGDIGVAGDVVVPLQQSPAGSGTWVVAAGTPALTSAQIARLRAGGYYVNVHTALNLPGEIRGQLIPSN